MHKLGGFIDTLAAASVNLAVMSTDTTPSLTILVEGASGSTGLSGGCPASGVSVSSSRPITHVRYE